MEDIHTLAGTVVTGDHYGEVLGFPTANLDTSKLQDVLEDIARGVYAGLVTGTPDKKTYKAGIVIGAQDTHHPPKVEAHLIDFSGNLYGETLTFHLKNYLREIKNYGENEDELKHDIAQDIEQIRSLTF